MNKAKERQRRKERRAFDRMMTMIRREGYRAVYGAAEIDTEVVRDGRRDVRGFRMGAFVRFTLLLALSS